MKVDYNQTQHQGYNQGRSIRPEALAGWMTAFRSHAPHARAWLDLGCGTGRFTAALADEFGGPVYGVEPAAAMRSQAPIHPGVVYLDGAAEAIPLADDAVDAVLCFLSFHHFRDRAAAAAELHRVLRPNGRLLIRSMFCDRMPDLIWHTYFPKARAAELDFFPSVAETRAALPQFETLALDVVPEPQARSLAERLERLRHRATSAFEYLSEAEIQAGFAALERDAAAETNPQTEIVPCDLLVLRPR